MSIGLIIGSITFSGSIIAFLKLQGLVSGKPLRFIGQKIVNLLLTLALIGLLFFFMLSQSLLPIFDVGIGLFFFRYITHYSYWRC